MYMPCCCCKTNSDLRFKHVIGRGTSCSWGRKPVGLELNLATGAGMAGRGSRGSIPPGPHLRVCPWSDSSSTVPASRVRNCQTESSPVEPSDVLLFSVNNTRLHHSNSTKTLTPDWIARRYTRKADSVLRIKTEQALNTSLLKQVLKGDSL